MNLFTANTVSALATIACAFPSALTPPGYHDIDRRSGVGGGIIGLALLVADLIQGGHNAWDADAGTCVISFSTVDGSDCRAEIACGGGIGAGEYQNVTLEPGPGTGLDIWEVCYLNGEQFFNHPSVGDFSITFTEAGGVNSDQDGLHSPVLKVAQIENWAPINVDQELAKADSGQQSGLLCTLKYLYHGYQYLCGVPEIGSSAFGITNTPEQSPTYQPGVCGIHFIQYQIPEGDDKYYLAARVVDSAGMLIAQLGNSYEVGGDKVDATNPVDITSPLPYVTIITVAQPGSAANVDEQPVKFAYAGQAWDSSSAQCSTGAYDSGSRQGDCSFTCS